MMMGGGVEATGGGGSCASCNSTNDSIKATDTAATSTDSAGFDANTQYAWTITIASQTCVTGFVAEVTDWGSSGNAILELFTDSAGVPGTIVGAGYSSTVSNLPDSNTSTEFLFAATQTLSAGTYHAVIKSSTGAGFLSTAATQSGSGTQHYSADGGANWYDYTTAYFLIRVLGCTP
jgi:hypothetical protein